MENITLFFTGYPRKADFIEKNKFKNMNMNFNYYKEIHEIAVEAQNILYNPKKFFKRYWKINERKLEVKKITF